MIVPVGALVALSAALQGALTVVQGVGESGTLTGWESYLLDVGSDADHVLLKLARGQVVVQPFHVQAAAAEERARKRRIGSFAADGAARQVDAQHVAPVAKHGRPP